MSEYSQNVSPDDIIKSNFGCFYFQLREAVFNVRTCWHSYLTSMQQLSVAQCNLCFKVDLPFDFYSHLQWCCVEPISGCFLIIVNTLFDFSSDRDTVTSLCELRIYLHPCISMSSSLSRDVLAQGLNEVKGYELHKLHLKKKKSLPHLRGNIFVH